MIRCRQRQRRGFAREGTVSQTHGMILRVSDDFAKRFKCELSFDGEKVPQKKRLDAWSCHFIRLGRKPVVVAMNDTGTIVEYDALKGERL